MSRLGSTELNDSNELGIFVNAIHKKLLNIFILVLFVYSMFTLKKNPVFAFTMFSVLFLVVTIMTHYASATQNSIEPEDIDVDKLLSLIDTATGHVNQTTKAIESGNSTMALRLLDEIRTDLNNINGNLTNLIFSVSQTPP